VAASTLEDLSSLLGAAAASDGGLVELCACAGRLAGSSGCAVIEWDELAASARLREATGTWEEEPLRPILERTASDWAFALGDAPVCAIREIDSVRATQWSAGARPASGLATPMRSADGARGVLLFTFAAPRVFSSDEVQMGRVIACHAMLAVRHRALAATVGRQAQTIARLVEDVDRMRSSLRRVPAAGNGEKPL